VTTPFRFLLRVRYGECDAQGIVFNARWGDYVDIAVTEYTRALLGSVDPSVTGIDWRLVKQTLEWRGPARYDDVLAIAVSTLKVGETSFTLGCEMFRHDTADRLATAETVYVRVDTRTGGKQALGPAHREAFQRGAAGVVVDHAGTATR
jgi:acyl-CoA thioester hydrolase